MTVLVWIYDVNRSRVLDMKWLCANSRISRRPRKTCENIGKVIFQHAGPHIWAEAKLRGVAICYILLILENIKTTPTVATITAAAAATATEAVASEICHLPLPSVFVLVFFCFFPFIKCLPIKEQWSWRIRQCFCRSCFFYFCLFYYSFVAADLESVYFIIVAVIITAVDVVKTGSLISLSLQLL